MWMTSFQRSKKRDAVNEYPARRSKFYRKTLLYILLISSIPTVLVAGINYVVGTSQLEREARSTQQFRFEQALTRLNETVASIELLATREALSSNVTKLFSDNNLYAQTDLLKSVMNTLFLFNEANPYIRNVRLFVKESNVLVTGEDGIVKITEERLVNKYRSKLTESTKGFHWAHGMGYNGGADVAQSESLILKIPWYTSDPAGALIIDINSSELNAMLNTIHDSAGFALLLSPDGQRIAASGNQLTKIEQEMNKRLLVESNLSDSSTIDLNNEKYMIFDEVLPSSSWRLVTGVPLSQINAPAIFTSRLLLGSFLFVIVTILIISYFTSLQLYNPIRRLMRMSEKFHGVEMSRYTNKGEKHLDEIAIIEGKWLEYMQQSEEVHLQMEKHMPELRKVFLMQCLLGHIDNISEEELVNQLFEYQLDVTGKGFVLLLVQMSGLSMTTTGFTQRDESLIQFTASNIIGEITQGRGYIAEVIYFQNLTVGLLLFVPSNLPKKKTRNDLIQLSQEIIGSLGPIIKLNISISVGRYYDKFHGLSKVLDEAYYGLQHRDLQEKNQILDIEEILLGSNPLPTYPFDLEKIVLQALLSGSEQEARMGIRNFALALSDARGIEILYKQGMFQLLGQVLNVILISGLDPYTLYQRRDLYDNLNALKEPEEIVNWFEFKVIIPFMREFNELKHARMKQMIEKVIAILHDDYNKDISLDYCADIVETTTFTLSKAFKEMTGSNFIDYLTDYRLNKAKELLCNTDLKVQEVAVQIGYQPPHFIRTFKKDTGTTPGKYRELHRKI